MTQKANALKCKTIGLESNFWYLPIPPKMTYEKKKRQNYPPLSNIDCLENQLPSNDDRKPLPQRTKNNNLITEHHPFAHQSSSNRRGANIESTDWNMLLSNGDAHIKNQIDPDCPHAVGQVVEWMLFANKPKEMSMHIPQLKVNEHCLAEQRRQHEMKANKYYDKIDQLPHPPIYYQQQKLMDCAVKLSSWLGDRARQRKSLKKSAVLNDVLTYTYHKNEEKRMSNIKRGKLTSGKDVL
ncbi:hypothetical protein SNEBB_008959 [Seison nebaliae]|nr:hypothetical protein SNEBB_008959 [Seison nebaliae]